MKKKSKENGDGNVYQRTECYYTKYEYIGMIEALYVDNYTMAFKEKNKYSYLFQKNLESNRSLRYNICLSMLNILK